MTAPTAAGAEERLSTPRLVALTALAMLAFAGNSLLCRLALKTTSIDPATFTAVRLLAGTATLWPLARLRPSTNAGRGNWASALALFAYAAGFSFAYVRLSAATGALLLFGAVQATMIGVGIARGERPNAQQIAGLALALGGLAGLLLPGLTAPPAGAAALMLGAGIAWGIYSLRGRGAGDPTRVTAGNFLRAAPLGVLCALPWLVRGTPDGAGIGYALASGALASGVGYALWYSVVPALRATRAAAVQLCVPVLATLGGAALLGEAITSRVVIASAAILGGIALVVAATHRD